MTAEVTHGLRLLADIGGTNARFALLSDPAGGFDDVEVLTGASYLTLGDAIRGALIHGGVIGPSWSIVRRATVFAVGGFDPSFHNCNDWDFYTRAAAAGARFRRIEDAVALYRTVAGSRLVNGREVGAENARRVLSHPYLNEQLITASAFE